MLVKRKTAEYTPSLGLSYVEWIKNMAAPKKKVWNKLAPIEMANRSASPAARALLPIVRGGCEAQ